MTKVAAYCRVSTDRSDQSNSFEAQQRFFQSYIEQNLEWELYHIYADRGITGTSTEKRQEFNRMIAEAQKGVFQILLTKDVSRFSRNILDTIQYTRRLRDFGVVVIFMNDGINTRDPDAELRLSIMASIAQEESRRISNRVVWGQTRQMENGVVFGHSLLGYRVKNGQLTVEPEGAEVVKWIFQKYAYEQESATEIARQLIDKGCKTGSGKAQWTANTVLKILRNEKYVGDLVQRKTYTPDYLTHRKKVNGGEAPMIRLENHHEAIISRIMWDTAQERLKKNNKHPKNQAGHSDRYVFSGKIRCGECGSSFVRKAKTRSDGSVFYRWCCSRASCMGANTCSVGRLIREDDAMNIVQSAVSAMPIDISSLQEDVEKTLLETIQISKARNTEQITALNEKIEQAGQKKISVMDNYFTGAISKEEMVALKCHYDAVMTSLRRELAQQMAQSVKSGERDNLPLTAKRRIGALLKGKEWSEFFYRSLPFTLVVFADRHIELTFGDLPYIFYFSE